MKKRKIMALLMVGMLTFSIMGSVTVHAEDVGQDEGTVAMFTKDLETGEEAKENIVISEDASVLNAESYQGESEELTPRIIIGEDETAAVPNMLLGMMPYSAIGRVSVTYYDGSSAIGTGFLFGPNDVATAGHVLFNDNGSIARTVTFWLPGTGGPVANYTGTQLAIPGEYMDSFDSNYDWGMFHINSNIGNTKGYMGWTSDISVNTTVQVIGYPSTQMIMAGKQVKSVTGTLVRYDVDTRPSQSGAPVLNRALNNQIVAIHSGGLEVSQLNVGCRVTARMASVLNSYRNE